MSNEDWQSYFKPGERLLWQGAPEPGFGHPWKSLALILFGIPFLLGGIGILIYGLHRLALAATGSDTGLAVFVMAFSLPFIAFGSFLSLGPIIEACTAARRIRYALSTRAAYIARSGLSRKVEVYPLIPATALEIEKGRRGDTVWFHARQEPSADEGLFARHAGFRNIADGERVYHLIRAIHDGETPSFTA